MTPEDRDILRAEAAIRIMAAMNTHAILPPYMPPGTRSEGEAETEQKKLYRQAARRAEFAVREANALIAELVAHEEFDPSQPTIENLVAEGVARGGQILSCKHGRASFEPCEKCDAEAAAGTPEGGKTPEPA